MEILLTSVAEAWRKKHTPENTTYQLADSTNNHIPNANEPINNPYNINTNIEPPRAAHDGNNNTRLRHLGRSIRIGAWPLGTSTGLSTENVDMMEPRAIVRTGSSISREEREVETCHWKQIANNAGSIPLSQEVQRLEWFRLLAVLLVLLICEVTIYVLIYGAIPHFAIIYTWYHLLRSFLTIGFYTTGYIVSFIVLTEYHSAIGAFLDRYLYFRRQYQSLSLRVLAYLYTACLLTRIALLLLGFQLFVIWFL